MNTQTFDFVIIGAGAAGAVLAHRLSEDPTVSVCLLEAGRRDTSPWLHLPAGFIKVINDPAWTWQFQSEPSAFTGGRRINLPQGRTLGGTTSINGMIYNRGQAEDYDQWAAQGNPGWSYSEVLPYFRRSEGHQGPADPQYHGQQGPVTVSRLSWKHPICDAFIAGGVAAGLPRNDDYNGARQAGIGYFHRTIGGRWRSSTARAFLKPAKGRSNLTVLTEAQTVELTMQHKTVTGVRYMVRRDASQLREVRARREVILSAGTLNTPKILELSGIGEPAVLARLGIPLRHSLPGVGENLADHYSVRVVAKVKGCATINEISRGPRLLREVLRWVFGRPSLLAVSPSLVHWFASTAGAGERPNLQGVFTPASYKEGAIGRLDNFPGMTAGVWVHRPKSRGSVHAQHRDPLQAPLIKANYLDHPDDRAQLLEGIRQARALLRSPSLAAYFDGEVLPGAAANNDAELLAFASRYGGSAQHLVGTSKMGPANDLMAVVDAELRVHGLKGLRIADASVMPCTPSANTCAASMMIGEKAADLLLGVAPLPAADMTVASPTPVLA